MSNVDHPAHYQGNGLEAITVIEAFGLGFNLGNTVKYVLRAGKKGDDAVTDLKKARWYLDREIQRLGAANEPRPLPAVNTGHKTVTKLGRWLHRIEEACCLSGTSLTEIRDAALAALAGRNPPLVCGGLIPLKDDDLASSSDAVERPGDRGWTDVSRAGGEIIHHAV